MVKIKSRKDIGTIFIYLIIVAVGAIVFLYGMLGLVSEETTKIGDYISSGFWAFLGVVTPLAILFALLKTEYVFDEDGVTFVAGIFKTKIPYSRIFVIKENRKFLAMYCLATQKLQITFKDEGNKSKPWGHIHVSPTSNEEFIKELKKHCKNLKVVK